MGGRYADCSCGEELGHLHRHSRASTYTAGASTPMACFKLRPQREVEFATNTSFMNATETAAGVKVFALQPLLAHRHENVEDSKRTTSK